MKIHLLTLILVASLNHSAFAHDHPVEDLLELPHPLRSLVQGELAQTLNDDQKAQVQTLRSEIQPQFLALMGEALPIQKRLQAAASDYDNRNPPSAADLERLARIRIRMSEIMAGAYNRLKVILDAPSWQTLQADLAHRR
ncbi:MAG TPA: hypothetical protein PLN02_03295 [Azonexus sp.]|nr:hypothetical protein [Azonexus sp.]